MELKQLTDGVTELLKIEKPEHIPNALMEVVMERKTEVYEEFCELVQDLSIDWMQKIFQYYLADRKEKMQDYTPASLAKLVGALSETETETTVLDLCAGSGAMTIQKWNMNHDLFFVCYECDKKVIPMLLFNLAVRNINAVVINGDALLEVVFDEYMVRKGERFGSVVDYVDEYTAVPDNCISNPPFNMKWNLPPFASLQSRFNNCELPPESNANYAFVLTGLDIAKDKTVMILPNGVLKTNNKQENEIKKYLVDQNLLEAVITCPDKMFESTSIGTCIMVLNRNKSTTHISFVDMRETFETEEREQNGQFGGASHENRTYKKTVKVFTDAQIQQALDCIRNQKAVPGFAKSVSGQTVKENDYNFVPARYIEFQEQEFVHREYAEIIDDLNWVINEKNGLKLTINATLADRMGLHEVFLLSKKSEEGNNDMNKALSFTGKKIEKGNYISESKRAGELKFENGSKDTISTILLSILQMWKQHIMYLNNEENRILVELRDAMLPDLMSGKIELCGGGEEET